MYKWICIALLAILAKVDLSAQITASETELKATLSKAKEDNNKQLIVSSYSDLGKYYTEKNKYDLALEYLCKAKRYTEENNLNYTGYYAAFAALFKRIGAITSSIEYEKRIFNLRYMDLGTYFSSANIGIGYLYLNEGDSALHYMHEQLNVAKHLKSYIAIASAYNNIGLVYLDKKEYNQALHYFTKAGQKLHDRFPSEGSYFKNELGTFQLSVKENQGRTYYHLKRYADATLVLQPMVDSGRYEAVNGNVYALFKSYLVLGKIPEAHTLLLQFTPGMEDDIDERILFTKMKMELAIVRKDLAKVNDCHNELQDLYKNQLIQHRNKENRLSQLVGKYLMIEMNQRLKNESEKSQFYASKLAFSKTRNRFILFIAIALLLLMSIGIYLYNQNVKNNKRKLKLDFDRLQMENEKHEYKIKLQENILTEFAIDYNRNRQEEDHIVLKLKKLAVSKTTDFKGDLNTIIAEIKLRQNINEKIEVVSRESILLQQEFQGKLLALNPQLTKNEIQLCFLVRLELTNKEIALYRNVSVDSIKVFKNRLRSKLNLPSADMLSEFLKSI